jgi:hypothetical protein
MNTNFGATALTLAAVILGVGKLPARADLESPEVTRLSSDASKLRTTFNADVGHARLLLLVSPTCPYCVQGARVIQDDVLSEIDDANLRVYVVWEPILPGDSYEQAQKSARFVKDRRVKQFWVPDRKLAIRFMKPLGLKEMPAWDVYLAYPRKTTWDADVPGPVFFSHQLPELPREMRLNGKRFANGLKSLLTTGSSDQGGK